MQHGETADRFHRLERYHLGGGGFAGQFVVSIILNLKDEVRQTISGKNKSTE